MVAHNATAQTDHIATLDTTAFETFESIMSSSPQLLEGEYSLAPLSIDLDDLGGSGLLLTGGNPEQKGAGHHSSFMSPISSSDTSYDGLPEHDYGRREAVSEDDESPPTPRMTQKEHNSRQRMGDGTAAGPSQDSVLDSPLQPVIRTVSREGTAPLRHPTPDLQLLQGAYGDNVARLERSAERLSTISDLRGELRRNVTEQNGSRSRQSSLLGPQVDDDTTPRSVSRHFSSGSTSKLKSSLNSTARSSHRSLGGYMPSPKGPIGSDSWSYITNRVRSASRGSRITQLSTPGQDNSSLFTPPSDTLDPTPAVSRTPIQGAMAGSSLDAVARNQSWPEPAAQLATHDAMEEAGLETRQELPDRPATAASTDTHRQATGLFVDFDGVHFTDQSGDLGPSHLRPSEGIRLSSNRSHVAERPQSYAEPLPGTDMVYYPAPVPMMLNLPQKLSKLPSATQREKRRSQILSNVLMGAKESTSRLSGVLEDGRDGTPGRGDSWRKSVDFGENANNFANLPPQLRASAFFEQPSTHPEIEVKGNSAVATLESILDASAYAPVSAFVDHPIIGQVGMEVYGMEKPSKSMGDISHKTSEARKSRRWSLSWGGIMDGPASKDPVKSSVDFDETRASLGKMGSTGQHGEENEDAVSVVTSEMKAFTQSHGPQHTVEGEQSSEEDEEFYDVGETLPLQVEEGGMGQDDRQPSVVQQAYSDRPTTLLAELQLRKQQQKSRNRTAATTFPNGMHSTLLELDTVAQIEKQSRKQKHVSLAWEDPGAQYLGPDNLDDEDIPLGMLFPGRKAMTSGPMGKFEDDRPLGLMEKREMEDNEPLSRRRARLRGDLPASRSRSPAKRNSAMYALEVPGLTEHKVEEPTGDEGETLGQRMRRLKAQGEAATGLHSRPISGDFTGEVMSQLGGVMPTDGEGVNQSAVETEEETLGQRRKRLQAGQDARVRDNERMDASSRPPLKARPSMANLLQNHPAAGARQASSERIPLATQPDFSIGNEATKGLLHQNRMPTEPKNSSALAGFHAPLDGNDRRRPKLGDLRSYSYGNHFDATGNNMAGGTGVPVFYSYCNPATRSAAGLNGYDGLLAANNTMRCSPSHRAGGAFGHGPHWGPNPAAMGPLPIALDPNQRDMIDRWRQSVMY